MNGKVILACADPVGAYWQLGGLPPAHGKAMLLGWRFPVPPVDSGVPRDVAAILSRAMTSVATVTFPVSHIGARILTEVRTRTAEVSSVGSTGLLERARAAFERAPATITLVSTRDPSTAATLFEDPGYPWHLQGQVAILSALDSGTPAIDRETLLSLLESRWDDKVSQLLSAGIAGFIRPGVEGDIAGVFTLAEESRQALLHALERAARDAGFDWRLLSEREFVDTLGTRSI